jgi:hypothetical protein
LRLLTASCRSLFGKIALDESEQMVNIVGMTQPDCALIAHALLTSSGFARVGLTAPSERIREAAAAELARTIVCALEGFPCDRDPRQMALPL